MGSGCVKGAEPVQSKQKVSPSEQTQSSCSSGPKTDSKVKVEEMSGKDVLLYLDIKARGEATRMLYKLAGTDFEDKRVTFDEWGAMKPDQPMGQVPTLTTSEGTLCQSTVIARHVARKLGMLGKTQWEETLHDLTVECVQECMNKYALPNIYQWLVFKSSPEPENKDEILEAAKQKWITVVNFLEGHSKKQGKKFLFGDEIGLGDIWLWCGLDFARTGTPDVMSLTPFLAEWSAKFEADPRVKSHLESRPKSDI